MHMPTSEVALTLPVQVAEAALIQLSTELKSGHLQSQQREPSAVLSWSQLAALADPLVLDRLMRLLDPLTDSLSHSLGPPAIKDKQLLVNKQRKDAGTVTV